MSVTRDYSIQNIENKDTFASAPTDYSGYSSGAVQGTNALLSGAISRTSTSGGRVATVKAGEDIRPALESLRSAGGGTLLLLAGVHRPTYDIVGGSKINIVGEGQDQTIIDFGNTDNCIIYNNTSLVFSTLMGNFLLENFTVQNSADTTGAIQINGCRDFRIENVKSYTNTSNGFYISSCWYFSVKGCLAENNSGDGFVTTSTATYPRDTYEYVFINNRSDGNVGSGFRLKQSSAYSNGSWSLMSCSAEGNDDDGFSVEDNGSAALIHGRLYGCYASSSGNWHYDIDGQSFIMVGCSRGNGGSVYRFSQYASGSVVGCQGGGYSIDPIASLTIIGSHFFIYAYDPPEDNLSAVDTDTIVLGTAGGSLITDRVITQMLNASGSTISAGSVVVYKANSTGDEITTTTTVGDDYVLGVSIFSVTNNNYSSILTEGKTSLLKVNGTTDIAIGDFLSTYSVAGIAAKANDGDMAFAIALEAYTANDSNGVIDALIISPRKVGASGGGGGGGLTALQVESLISIRM